MEGDAEAIDIKSDLRKRSREAVKAIIAAEYPLVKERLRKKASKGKTTVTISPKPSDAVIIKMKQDGLNVHYNSHSAEISWGATE